jgi:cytochrome c peroxidase
MSCSNEYEGEAFEEDKMYNLEVPTNFPALAFDIEKIL